jgi:inorganic triphosphatase YgiF
VAEEIELKLALPEAAQRRFLGHPLLKAASGRQTRELRNIYYDTPDLALRRHGIALRLRRQGRIWLQTVKCAGDSLGGLSRRPEWETRYFGVFDFSTVDDQVVRSRLDRYAARLLPAFETRFRRTTWHYDGVLLMFDRGWIAADERREPISELELELDGGSLDALFDLVEQLADGLPLLPAVLSKADRGFHLRQGAAPAPGKAATVPIHTGMTPLAAFRTIALACVDHLHRNHAGVMGTEDPEYIHQLRVAARRLRANLRLFAPLLPADRIAVLMPPLRGMMTVLGQARDLDVLCTEIIVPVMAARPGEQRLAALAAIVDERRRSAREDALRFLSSMEYSRWILDLTGFLYRLPISGKPEAASVVDYSRSRLHRLRRRLKNLIRRARNRRNADSLHALRIGIKRLRYSLEFFAPLAKGRRRRRLAGRLAAMQSTLGELNDLAGAGILLSAAGAGDPRLEEAAQGMVDWHEPRRRRLLRRLPGLIDELERWPRL